MSREEAIKELTDLLPEEFLSEYTEAIKMGIEALEQEPKMGHWVKVIEENGHAFYLCSVCKCGVEESFNWCPNCGSKNGGAE